jgi:hypothetical protein
VAGAGHEHPRVLFIKLLVGGNVVLNIHKPRYNALWFHTADSNDPAMKPTNS